MPRNPGSGRYDVFISYAHADEREHARAADLAAQLQFEGLSVWFDKELMELPGVDWHNVILNKMKGARLIVALWSRQYFTRPLCVFESQYAAGANKLLPFELEPLRPEDFRGELLGLTYHLNRVSFELSSTARKIAERLRIQTGRSTVATGSARSVRVLTGDRVSLPPELSAPGANLVGRAKEVGVLRRAWASCAPNSTKPKTNVVVLHGVGGCGKTTVVSRFLRDALTSENPPDCVLGWSAYSQGSSDRGATDSDSFVVASLRFLGTSSELPFDPVARALLLAIQLKGRKALLVLDGLETLQRSDPDHGLRLTDRALDLLINELARGHPGLLVVAAREPISELSNSPAPEVLTREFRPLSTGAAVQLLRQLGCWGRPEDLRRLAGGANGHGLTLALLGAYVSAAEGGDTSRTEGINASNILSAAQVDALDDKTARLARRTQRVVDFYLRRIEARTLANPDAFKAERALLALMGLFNRTADKAAIAALLRGPPIPGLTDEILAISSTKRRRVLSIGQTRLASWGLLGPSTSNGQIDAHPIIRNYFGERLKKSAPDAYRAANQRLFEHYAAAAPPEPTSLASMQPLFHSIFHGCQAGRHQLAWNEVYQRRIRRNEEHFISRNLGAFSADLSTIENFFAEPFAQPHSELVSATARAALLGYAAFDLRALGRGLEAKEAFEAAFSAEIPLSRLDYAAVAAGNLCEACLLLGEVERAIALGRIAVELADGSKKPHHRVRRRTSLAEALQQAGATLEAEQTFREAEQIQKDHFPERPQLYSIYGYRYCDLLLDLGRADDVLMRLLAKDFRVNADNQDDLLAIALDRLARARANAMTVGACGRIDQAAITGQLDDAVLALRRAGALHHLPRGLLARAGFSRERFEETGEKFYLERCLSDLDEVFGIADHGAMALYMIDWRIELVRLKCGGQSFRPEVCRASQKRHSPSRRALAAASIMSALSAEVEKVGYLRRRFEVAELAQSFQSER